MGKGIQGENESLWGKETDKNVKLSGGRYWEGNGLEEEET